MRVIPFADLAPEDLDRARQIYEGSFPAWEREDFGGLLARGADDGVVQLACSVGGSVVGIAALSALESVGWAFLEYFALAPGMRGQGLGSTFWPRVRGQVEGPVVLEVEHPEQPGIGPDELAIRLARIRFWQRMGFERLQVPAYLVPRMDSRDLAPMLVMATQAPKAPLMLEALIAALYAEGYGLSDADQRADLALGGNGHV